MLYNTRMLEQLACPNCQNAIDPRAHGQHVTCEACGGHFILDGHFCANCHAYYKEEVAFCQECGTAMNRVCRKCNTRNWAGDEYCSGCGAALDIFELLHQQTAVSTADRLYEQQKRARAYKEQEKIASEKRMAELMEIEKERQLELARRYQIQQKKDQQLYLMAGGVVIAALIIVALLIAFTS